MVKVFARGILLLGLWAGALPALAADAPARGCNAGPGAGHSVLAYVAGRLRALDVVDGADGPCLSEGGQNLNLSSATAIIASLTAPIAVAAPITDATTPGATSADQAAARDALLSEPAPMPRAVDTGAPGDLGPATAGDPAFDQGVEPGRISPKFKSLPEQAGTPDQRVRVADSTVFPNNTIAFLASTYPSGKVFSCTATLVTPYVALTAGHCVFNVGEGGYATRVRVSPALNAPDFTADPTFPYGNRLGASWITTDQWKQVPAGDTQPLSNFVYDVAAVYFNAPFPVPQRFLPVSFDTFPTSVINAGYPGVVGGQNNSNSGQWTDNGPVGTTSGGLNNVLLTALLDASSGDSGGPFWTPSSLGQTLVASLSAGTDGVRAITGPRYVTATTKSVIASWMAYSPPLTPETGWWWDPTTGGRGFAMETHPTNGRVFFAAYQYGADGRDEWVTATLSPVSTGVFQGAVTLTTKQGSSTLGNVTLTLSSQTNGSLAWPAGLGGGTTKIQRYPLTGSQIFAPNYGYSAQSGWWWDPTRAGSGYMIEIQNSHLFFGAFSQRTSDGTPFWTVADADMSSTTTFAASLTELSGGARYALGATGKLTSATAGSVNLTFNSNTSATLVLNGQTIALQRFSSF